MNAAYELDPRLLSLKTTVIEVGEEEGRPFVVTADTLLYPEGGGQPADHGSINGCQVIDVQRRHGRIVHYLTTAVAPGPAEIDLDWPRRWDHMQQHTGQHLLTAVADRRFGWATTAFHLGPELSDIELAVDHLGETELRELEQAVAEEILLGRPVSARSVPVSELAELGVRSRGLPEDHHGDVRLVEIEGLDLNTCGGTHLASTAEIGLLAILGSERLRGGTRVLYAAGDRACRRLVAHEARNAQLRKLLGAPDAELSQVVELRLGKEKELAGQVRRLLDELAAAEAISLAGQAGDAPLARHWPDRDLAYLQQVARTLAGSSPAACGLLTAGSGDQGLFLLLLPEQCPEHAATTCLAELLQLLDGRGGGNGRIRQGKARAVDRRDQALAVLATLTGGATTAAARPG